MIWFAEEPERESLRSYLENKLGVKTKDSSVPAPEGTTRVEGFSIRRPYPQGVDDVVILEETNAYYFNEGYIVEGLGKPGSDLTRTSILGISNGSENLHATISTGKSGIYFFIGKSQ